MITRIFQGVTGTHFRRMVARTAVIERAEHDREIVIVTHHGLRDEWGRELGSHHFRYISAWRVRQGRERVENGLYVVELSPSVLALVLPYLRNMEEEVWLMQWMTKNIGATGAKSSSAMVKAATQVANV